MRKLLLLLPLILAGPVLAESDPFGLGKHAFEKYRLHFNNAYKFMDLEDYEMVCSELRMASTVLKVNFSLLQQYKPDFDFFKGRANIKYLIEGGCQ